MLSHHRMGHDSHKLGEKRKFESQINANSNIDLNQINTFSSQLDSNSVPQI